MNQEVLTRCEKLAAKGAVVVATADSRGMPHVAAAGRLSVPQEGMVSITEWFCPGTIANVQENDQVSVVAWDQSEDEGIQLLGRLENEREIAVLDGYVPQEEGDTPQVEKELLIRVEKALEFSEAPHSDREK